MPSPFVCIFEQNASSQRLPATLDQHVIHGDRQLLRNQLRVVTKRVFAGILEKQSACLKEMSKVEEVGRIV